MGSVIATFQPLLSKSESAPIPPRGVISHFLFSGNGQYPVATPFPRRHAFSRVSLPHPLCFLNADFLGSCPDFGAFSPWKTLFSSCLLFNYLVFLAFTSYGLPFAVHSDAGAHGRVCTNAYTTSSFIDLFMSLPCPNYCLLPSVLSISQHNYPSLLLRFCSPRQCQSENDTSALWPAVL